MPSIFDLTVIRYLEKVLVNTFAVKMSVAFTAIHHFLPQLFPGRIFSVASTVIVAGKSLLFDFWCEELQLAIHYYSTCLNERGLLEKEELRLLCKETGITLVEIERDFSVERVYAALSNCIDGV